MIKKEKRMDHFKLVSDYRPSGDQPQAIEGLVNGVNLGLREKLPKFRAELRCQSFVMGQHQGRPV